MDDRADIVERLRTLSRQYPDGSLGRFSHAMFEAADEIVRLREAWDALLRTNGALLREIEEIRGAKGLARMTTETDPIRKHYSAMKGGEQYDEAVRRANRMDEKGRDAERREQAVSVQSIDVLVDMFLTSGPSPDGSVERDDEEGEIKAAKAMSSVGACGYFGALGENNMREAIIVAIRALKEAVR